ncbi:MAG: hypothetical protein JST38_18435 [Bacteroidetes bacterium]|nr:hypothetical protein [Bacteroidota bacterium]
MDWREYIQEREHFATPQRGHLAALLAAMHDRPGTTPGDAELARRREEERNAEQAASRQRVLRVEHMGFDEYLARKNSTNHEAAHPF